MTIRSIMIFLTLLGAIALIGCADNPTDLENSAQLADTKIAFLSDRDGNREVYVMNADGSNPVNLTNHLEDDFSPSWLPTASDANMGH